VIGYAVKIIDFVKLMLVKSEFDCKMVYVWIHSYVIVS